jgi:hypothetical protein
MEGKQKTSGSSAGAGLVLERISSLFCFCLTRCYNRLTCENDSGSNDNNSKKRFSSMVHVKITPRKLNYTRDEGGFAKPYFVFRRPN